MHATVSHYHFSNEFQGSKNSGGLAVRGICTITIKCHRSTLGSGSQDRRRSQPFTGLQRRVLSVPGPRSHELTPPDIRPLKRCAAYPQTLSRSKCGKKIEEPADAGSPGKWFLILIGYDVLVSNYHIQHTVAAGLSGRTLVSNLDQRSYSTTGPLSTGMGDRLREGTPPQFIN